MPPQPSHPLPSQWALKDMRYGGWLGWTPPPLARGGGSEQRNQRTKILSLSTDVGLEVVGWAGVQEPNKEE